MKEKSTGDLGRRRSRSQIKKEVNMKDEKERRGRQKNEGGHEKREGEYSTKEY